MNYKQIMESLYEENSVEKIQKLSGKNFNDQNLPYEKVPIPKMPESNFFEKGNVFINKHHRYSIMPPHTHEFVEINYMASGNSTHYVNNEKIHLHAGDVLLMDREVVQSINPLNKDDILINILIKEESITTDIILDIAKSNSLVKRFFINASSQYSNHNNYIYFKVGDVASIQTLLKKIIVEYYNEKHYYIQSINLLLSLMIIELSRVIERDSELSINDGEYDMETIEILRYIENNYANLTLSKLSDFFGYNANYLSNKLKIETGFSFQELINSSRYNNAVKLLKNTDKTMEEISNTLGFKTTPALYKLLSKFTDMKPQEIRRNNVNSNK